MKFGFFTTVVLALFLGNAVQAETYVCKVKPEGRDTGWISKVIALSVDSKTGTVLVNDAIILGAYKRPIPATLIIST